MARYRVILGGMTIEMDDPKDVMALALGGNNREPVATSRTGDRRFDSVAKGIEFLELLKESKDGVTAKVFRQQLGYKSFGPLAKCMRHRMKAATFKDAYEGALAGKDRIWFAGSKIDQAIQEMEAQLHSRRPSTTND